MDAKLISFNLDKLGYYTYQGESVVGTPSKKALFREFIDWGRSRDSIDETKLVNIPHDDTSLGYFFIDGAFNDAHDQFAFVMWRETPADGGKIYGVRKDVEPGTSNVMTSRNFDPEREIPGFPSYFWYDLRSNVLINVVFQHSSSSKRHLSFFLKEFLKKETDFTTVVENDQGIKNFIHRVQDDGNDKRVYPKVAISTLKVDQVLQFLKENQHEIIGIRKEEDLSYVRRAEPENLFEYAKTMFSFLPAIDVRRITQSKRKFTYEMDWHPTDEDLDIFVGEAQAAIAGDSIIKDIKLKFKGGSYKSVKDIYKMAESSFDIQKEDSEFFSATLILRAMEEKRDGILAELEI